MGNIIRNLIEFHFLNSMVVFEYIRIIRHIFSILIPAYCFCLTMYVIITIILMKEKNLMDFLQLKAEYEKKLLELRTSFFNHIHNSSAYEEESVESIDEIYADELIWDTANDHRVFENIQNLICVYENIISIIDGIITASDNQKKTRNLKKDIESLIHQIRKLKKESSVIIKHEQDFTDKANDILDLLDEIRGK